MMGYEPERDRYGRPLITPPSGGEAVAYTRASTIAGVLDDQSALTAWKGRMAAVGLAKAPHLLDRVSALVATSSNPVADERVTLNRLVSDASTAAGGQTAADLGTSLHSFTEAVDDGAGMGVVPERWREHVSAYQRVMADAGMTVIDSEVFTVNDEYRVAGTFDRILKLADGRVVIADIKTGKNEPRYPMRCAIQMAAYGNGVRYVDGVREPIDERLDPSIGVMVHMPVADPSACRLYEVDLMQGRECLDVAVAVRRARALKPTSLCDIISTHVSEEGKQ